MNSSYTKRVTSQPASRATPGSDNTYADSAPISLMQHQSSPLSTPAQLVPVARNVALPHPRVHRSNSTNKNKNELSKDAMSLRDGKCNYTLEDAQGALTLSGATRSSSKFLGGPTATITTATTTPVLPLPLPAQTHAAARTISTADQLLDASASSPPVPVRAPQRSPAPSSLTDAALNCNFAPCLRSAVQQQRGISFSDQEVHGVRVCTTETVASVTTQQRLGVDKDASSSGHSSHTEEDEKADVLLPVVPATFYEVASDTTTAKAAKTVSNLAPLTSLSPSPVEASAVPPLYRQHTTLATAPIVDAEQRRASSFDISSLAQFANNCSMSSMTTQPPATASETLVKTKKDGYLYINNYRLERTLGKGACGKVKLAYDEDQKRWVAIKVVRRADTRKRIGGLTTAQKQYNSFMREIEVMKKLRHRNIVSLYEVIDDPSADKLYLVMQYVDKGMVSKVEVRANSDYVCDPIPPAQLARYAREMLTGLQYLHRHNVVHRDLKPDNILVSKDGHAYLADFGVAETFDTSYRKRMEKLMQKSMAIGMAMSTAGNRASGPQVVGTKGTPLFLAPELWDGAKSYGKPVDMWAMGVTLFTLLVGKLPFRSPEDICDSTFLPTVPEEFGEKWRTLLNGLLNRNPQARWTVEKASSYMQFCLEGADAPPLPLTPKAPPPIVASAPTTFTHITDDASSDPLPWRTEATLTASSTDSHVFDVDFLPMPNGTDQTLTPALSKPSTPLTSTVIAVAPSVAQAREAGTATATTTTTLGTAEATAEGGDGELALKPSSTLTSPFDNPPAMAHAPCGNCRIGQMSNTLSSQLVSPLGSGQCGAMLPLPPNLALERLPTIQLGEASGPRGRRTQQHQRGNNGASGSRSATRSKSRENGKRQQQQSAERHQWHHPHHLHLGAAAVTAALNAQQREMQRQASLPQQLKTASGEVFAVCSAALFPPESPIAPLPRPSEPRGCRHKNTVDTPIRRKASAQAWQQQGLTRLPSQRRISSTGTQQSESMGGVFMPSSQVNGANVLDNAGLACVVKPHEDHHHSHQFLADSRRIQNSSNRDGSAYTVNRVL